LQNINGRYIEHAYTISYETSMWGENCLHLTLSNVRLFKRRCCSTPNPIYFSKCVCVIYEWFSFGSYRALFLCYVKLSFLILFSPLHFNYHLHFTLWFLFGLIFSAVFSNQFLAQQNMILYSSLLLLLQKVLFSLQLLFLYKIWIQDLVVLL
jgi:hypothetical protein